LRHKYQEISKQRTPPSSILGLCTNTSDRFHPLQTRPHPQRSELLSESTLETSAVIQEIVVAPRVTVGELREENAFAIQSEQSFAELIPQLASWMSSLVKFLLEGRLPSDLQEAQQIKKNAAKYTLIDGHIFHFRFCRPLLAYVKEEEAYQITTEFHEGMRESH